MAMQNPLTSPFVTPSMATPRTDTAGVGGVQSAPGSPEEFQKRVSGWDTFLQMLAKPETGRMLTDFGFSLMGGRQPGETTGGLFNRSYQTAQAGVAQREDRALRRDAITAQTEQTRAQTADTRSRMPTAEDRELDRSGKRTENARLQELVTQLKNENNPERQKALRELIAAQVSQTQASAGNLSASAENTRAATLTPEERALRQMTTAADASTAVSRAAAASFGANPDVLQSSHDADTRAKNAQADAFALRGSSDTQRVNARIEARLSADPRLDRNQVTLEEWTRAESQDQVRAATTVLQNFPMDLSLAQNDPVKLQAVVQGRDWAMQILQQANTAPTSAPSAPAASPPPAASGSAGRPVAIGRVAETGQIQVQMPDGSVQLMSRDEALRVTQGN